MSLSIKPIPLPIIKIYKNKFVELEGFKPSHAVSLIQEVTPDVRLQYQFCHSSVFVGLSRLSDCLMYQLICRESNPVTYLPQPQSAIRVERHSWPDNRSRYTGLFICGELATNPVHFYQFDCPYTIYFRFKQRCGSRHLLLSFALH